MSFSQRPHRILCLWFPDWSVQRLILSQPSLARSFVILTEHTKRGDSVYQGNDFAQRRGVRPGMPVSEARTLARPHDPLVIQPVRPDEDKIALTELAFECEPYSFCIGLEEAERPECLLMDVTGIAHFFGGEETLAVQLQQDFFHRGWKTRLAIANTVGMAWAVAHCLGQPGQRVIVPTDDRKWRNSLPVESLRIPDTILSKLKRLGLRTVESLLQCNRASLWSRFGEDLLRRIDQLTGERPEPIVPCRPIPRFAVARTLEHGLTQPEAIEQFWRSMLDRLVALLAPKRLGTRHLRCCFITEDRTDQRIDVRLCTTEGDARRLADLLRLQLEQQQWHAPLMKIEMEALEVAPLDCPQQELFEGESHDQTRRCAQLLDRLSNRLGEQAVTRPVCQPNPIPELAIRLVPVTESGHPSMPGEGTLFPLDRPTALFPRPRPIEVMAAVPEGPPTVLFWRSARFEIAHHGGSERIEFGWWLGPCVRRDYYRVTTTEGRRLWIFRRLQDDRWFWHGEWF